VGVAALVVGAVTNGFSSASQHSVLIAHRGAYNPFNLDDPNCPTLRLTAIRYPGIIENTLESVKLAFVLGADIVEVDLKVTKDNQVVLFHDDELGCKTNGQGKVSDHTLSYINNLDAGFNYSADDGKTFPFRGKGIGKIITLKKLIQAVESNPLFLNPKDSKRRVGRVLADALSPFRGTRDYSRYMFWGDYNVYMELKRYIPEFGPFVSTPFQNIRCYSSLDFFSWFGMFPEACRNFPLNLSPEIWTKPYFKSLLKLAKQYKSEITLWAVNDRRSFIGLNGLVPYIMTSDIGLLGPKETPFSTEWMR
jgi:glycerophosphoryl diester phosphodiesterase